jgi:hypothetical protein
MTWLADTFGFAGANMNMNSSLIDLSWSYSINGTPVFDLYEVWNATTGLMISYDLTYYGVPGEESETMQLSFRLVGEITPEPTPTPVDQTPATTGISFLDTPSLPVNTGLLMFAVMVLRKRRLKL